MNETGPIPSPATTFWLAVNAPAISFAVVNNNSAGGLNVKTDVFVKP